MLKNKMIIRGLLVILVLFLVYIYYRFNPLESAFFPKCPFRQLTGWECAGCGSQRAMHQLLHLDFKGAFAQNPLLVISIPYIFVGFILDLPKIKQNPTLLKWRNHLLGMTAIYFWLVVVILFWIGRNIF